MSLRMQRSTIALLSAALLVPVTASAFEKGGDDRDHSPSTPLASNQYLVTNLTTNTATGAPFSDPNLVNPWGLSRSSGGPWWVSDNGTGLSTLYTGGGATIPLVVTIPPADASSGNLGSPTGTIYNGTSEFSLSNGSPAFFLFATEDGTISGWNGGSSAVIAVNESKQGASFKGLTSAVVNLPAYPGQTLLYTADFTLGKIEVFDSKFHHVQRVEEEINEVDVPEDFSPFNVQNLGGNLYVTYAKRGAGINEQDGPGLGEVRVFSAEGHRLLRLQRGWFLNAPWGLAIAPSDFGAYSHSILVGNFGNGWIAAFNPITGEFQDFLRDGNGKLITIPGLWGIAPGNDGKAGNATSLYFAAGGANEASGVLGSITALQNPQGNDQ